MVLLASAVLVKQDAPLRAGCDPADQVVARVPAESPAEIRFAISGTNEACYKISVKTGGKTVDGYVPASVLTGLDEFTKQIQGAPALSMPRVSLPDIHATPDHSLARASNLLEQRQPRAALDVVEQAMRVHGRDYQHLVLAGISAYQADEPRIALEYLRDSQRMQEDLPVRRLIAKLEKEQSSDKSGDKLYGNRFVLRYEGGNLDVEIARSLVATLEQEFSRIASQLGCRAEERIVTIVQSWPAYRATTGASEWSGGQFDGKIRIPIANGNVLDDRTRQAFAHELVHACLANLGSWPAWLHEGMAQKLSGEVMTPGMRSSLRSLMRANKVPRLENLSQSWSRLSAQHAAAAYAIAFAAADLMMEMYANFGIANVLRNPSMLPQVTQEIDKRLFAN